MCKYPHKYKSSAIRLNIGDQLMLYHISEFGWKTNSNFFLSIFHNKVMVKIIEMLVFWILMALIPNNCLYSTHLKNIFGQGEVCIVFSCYQILRDGIGCAWAALRQWLVVFLNHKNGTITSTWPIFSERTSKNHLPPTWGSSPCYQCYQSVKGFHEHGL